MTLLFYFPIPGTKHVEPEIVAFCTKAALVKQPLSSEELESSFAFRTFLIAFMKSNSPFVNAIKSQKAEVLASKLSTFFTEVLMDEHTPITVDETELISSPTLDRLAEPECITTIPVIVNIVLGDELSNPLKKSTRNCFMIIDSFVSDFLKLKNLRQTMEIVERTEEGHSYIQLRFQAQFLVGFVPLYQRWLSGKCVMVLHKLKSATNDATDELQKATTKGRLMTIIQLHFIL